MIPPANSEELFIRPMLRRDLDAAADLYVNFMFDSFYAQLGHGFVRALLAGFLAARSEISLVGEVGDRLAGFITVSTDSRRTTREAVATQWPALMRATAAAVLRQPAALGKLLRTAEYFRQTGDDLDSAVAEMMFITVHPEYRRQRVGEKLIVAVLREYRLRGVRRVKVTTVKENQPVQRLLERLGFTRRGFFRFYDKDMALFARPL